MTIVISPPAWPMRGSWRRGRGGGAGTTGSAAGGGVGASGGGTTEDKFLHPRDERGQRGERGQREQDDERDGEVGGVVGAGADALAGDVDLLRAVGAAVGRAEAGARLLDVVALLLGGDL